MKSWWYLLRTSFCSYTAITVLSLFSIIVAVFGLNVILGYAETYYRSGAGSTMYTVITIAGLDKETQNTDILTELEQYSPSAAVYICRTEDGAILAGFDGSDEPGNWGPHTMGSFVNSPESDHYPYVIYLGEWEAQNTPLGDMYELDGRNYRLIGCGGWIPQNFISLISQSSPQTVFDWSGSRGDMETITNWIRVIPYEAFRKAYVPELILVHFPEMNYGQILRMTDRLGKMHPGCSVTPPNRSSDELMQQALQIMRQFIPLYLILTEISVVLTICELYRKLRRECLILRICGISGRKLKGYLIAEVGTLFVLGTGVALLLQLGLKEFLSVMGAEKLPVAWEVAAGAGILFVLAVVLSLPEMNEGLRMQRSEGT